MVIGLDDGSYEPLVFGTDLALAERPPRADGNDLFGRSPTVPTGSSTCQNVSEMSAEVSCRWTSCGACDCGDPEIAAHACC